MSQHHVLERGDLRVELVNIGEGYQGDYTGNPDDRQLLRFYVQGRVSNNPLEDQFEDLDDGSYCTVILHDEHDNHERFLTEIMDAAEQWQASGDRRIIEKVSWIGSG